MDLTKELALGIENDNPSIFKDLVVIKNTDTSLDDHSIWLSNKRTHTRTRTQSAILIKDRFGRIFKDVRDRSVFIGNLENLLKGYTGDYRFNFLMTDKITPLSYEDYMVFLHFVQYNNIKLNLKTLEIKDLEGE